MVGHEYTIELEDDATGYVYEVDVEITHFLDVKPNSRADNPDDYYGYQEIEFDVVEVFRYDDMGTEVKVASVPGDLQAELKYQVEYIVMKEYEDGVY